MLLPLLDMRADKAFLVTKASRTGSDKAEAFLRRIERGTAESGIETERVGCDISDFYDCLRVVGGVVASELKAGNMVFVNISSGGRVLSHASAVAGMMWDARMYYVEPEVDERETREFTKGMRSVSEVPTFHIDRPLDIELVLMEMVEGAGGATTKKHLISRMQDRGLIQGKQISRQAQYQALRRILGPLADKGWVEISGETRSSRVKLTGEGERVLRGFESVG